MTNLEIEKAYVGGEEVVKVYLGGDVIYESTPPTPPAPSYVEFRAWFQTGSSARTIGSVLLVKQNTSIWTGGGGSGGDQTGYLTSDSYKSTGTSNYVIKIAKNSPMWMPFQYHDAGISTWSYMSANGTETINGETFDRYDLPVNVYMVDSQDTFKWSTSVPTGNLYILPPA